MTIQHFVFAKAKAGTSDEEKAKGFKAATELIFALNIPGMKGVKAGPPLQTKVIRAQGYDFALTAEFDNPQVFKRYLVHPLHLKLLGLLQSITDDESLLIYQIDTSATSKL